jgi:hypothetical protein
MSLLSSELTPVVPGHSAPGATRQKLKPSSSVGAIPRSSDPRLQDMANMLGLNLPPITLQVLSEAQASGRLSEIAIPRAAKVPAPATRRSTTTKGKRTTARAHTQPNLIKSGGASSYAQGVPARKAVAQPLEAVQYQPPPVKARVRRAALAAEFKAKEAPSPTIWGFSPAMEQLACTASWGNRAKSMSMPTLQPRKAGQSQNEAMLPPSTASAGSSRAPTRPSTPSDDRMKYTSLPTLQRSTTQGSMRTAASHSQENIIDRILPRMKGILDAARAPPKRSKTWVAGDAPDLGDNASSNASSKSPLALYEPPFLPTMEMPEAETLDFELPRIEQPSMEELAAPPFTTTAHRDEVGPSETDSSTTIGSLPSVDLQTFEDLEAFLWGQNSCTAIPEPVLEEDPSAALDRILDLELSQVLQATCGAAQTAPVTREEIEMSLFPQLITTPTNLDHTTGLESDVEMADAEIDDLLRHALDLLDENWVGFVDFGGY